MDCTIVLFFIYYCYCVKNDTEAAESANVDGESGIASQDASDGLVYTLSWLRRAVELDPTSYDAWHEWALMNYQLTQVVYKTY